MAVKVKSHQKSRPRSFGSRLIRVLRNVLLLFLAITILPVLLYSVVNPPFTPLMWIRWVESGYESSYPRSIKQWIPLEETSPHLLKAVIGAEDQKFFQHKGFDWEALEKAIQHNKTSKKTLGASTISMQTARNVFLWQSRTWLRKGLEAYYTFLIETFWSKKRILEVYVNVIEWGNGVFGCAAATEKYFHRSPKSISPIESAWLAAVLPNPRKWARPIPSKRVERRQARILKAMGGVKLPLHLQSKT